MKELIKLEVGDYKGENKIIVSYIEDGVTIKKIIPYSKERYELIEKEFTSIKMEREVKEKTKVKDIDINEPKFKEIIIEGLKITIVGTIVGIALILSVKKVAGEIAGDIKNFFKNLPDPIIEEEVEYDENIDIINHKM